MVSGRSILVVEPDGSQAQLLAVAIERTCPGTQVDFTSLEQAATGALAPRIVILGMTASDGVAEDALARLRETLGGVPLIALIAPDGAPPEALDAVYVQPSEWRALCATMRELLDAWFAPPP